MLRERIRDTIVTHGPNAWRNRAVWSLIVYYFGVWSENRKNPLLRWTTSKIYGFFRLFSEIVTGVTIERSMQLPGLGLHIIHPTSVYIHPLVKLGARVGLMHNVCLGTNMGDDAPIIGDDVFIGTGAAILGRVTIGNGARVAANSLVINNVPPGSFAIGVPAKNMMIPSVREQRDKSIELVRDN